jgi:hypothetical protein
VVSRHVAAGRQEVKGVLLDVCHLSLVTELRGVPPPAAGSG